MEDDANFRHCGLEHDAGASIDKKYFRLEQSPIHRVVQNVRQP
jgi:hypothetical protein